MPTWVMWLIRALWPIFKPIIIKIGTLAWQQAEQWVESHLDQVPAGRAKGEYKAALFDWKVAAEPETASLSAAKRNLLREVVHDQMAKG